MRFLDRRERQKTNLQVVRGQMINLLKRTKERFFSEIYEGYEPEDTGKEKGNNIFMENIIGELKRKYYSENQINEALYYYNTIGKHKRNTLGSGRNMERRRLYFRIKDKIKQVKRNLKKDPEFFDHLLKNLEAANIYDFI